MTTVVAAVIRRAGRILICRRSAAAQQHRLKWEFPGGKVDAGEGPQQALCRELQEELELHAHIGPELERYTFAYPGKSAILLIFYVVTEFEGEPRNCVFEEIRWVARADLVLFDFLEGDLDFIARGAF